MASDLSIIISDVTVPLLSRLRLLRCLSLDCNRARLFRLFVY